MLEELSIQNYALIESLTVKFQPGLNILSGETGAGKSIIVGALGLLLGGKGDPALIRTGCEEARVSGVIKISGNKDLVIWLKDKDIYDDEGYILIRRTLKTTGRGTLSVQSTPVTRSELTELTSLLFDMHGQHVHQSLLNIDNHRKLLDSYADITDEVEKLKGKFNELSVLKKKLEDLRKSERNIILERDILNHAVKEIDESHLQPDEEDALVRERTILLEHENLVEIFEKFKAALSDETNGALARLRIAGESLNRITAIINSSETYQERWDNAFFEIEDIFTTIKDIEEGIEYSPQRLEECEDRLQIIRRLKKKYGNSIQDVLNYRIEAEKKLLTFENREEDINKLEKLITEVEKDVFNRAHKISNERRSRAVLLEREILKGLKHLGMEKASFSVNVCNRESDAGKAACGPTGMDVVEFLISTNEGEPLKPLKTIASGGELSRIMLSIKSVLADSDNIATLIFDEIDTGIGGEIALAVGEHLAFLSRNKQILCITHLASIAVRADNHLKVDKIVEEGRTFTEIQSVSGDDRVKEIARMLAGDTHGAASLDHARELLNRYRK